MIKCGGLVKSIYFIVLFVWLASKHAKLAACKPVRLMENWSIQFSASPDLSRKTADHMITLTRFSLFKTYLSNVD